MTQFYETILAFLPPTHRLDRLAAIGWEDFGGVVLAACAVAVMAAVGAVRSR